MRAVIESRKEAKAFISPIEMKTLAYSLMKNKLETIIHYWILPDDVGRWWHFMFLPNARRGGVCGATYGSGLTSESSDPVIWRDAASIEELSERWATNHLSTMGRST